MYQFIRESSAQDFADMAIQTKDAKQPFDPGTFFDSNPEFRNDRDMVDKLADADAYIRHRGSCRRRCRPGCDAAPKCAL